MASGCVGLAIAICATMFSRLALLAQAAVIAKLVLHSLFLMQMFLFPGIEVRLIWDTLHLALVALYTCSRVSSPAPGGGVGRMDALDWSFIAWGFLGHAVDFGARLAIRWVVVPRLFEQYLRSFDGDAFREEKNEGKGVGAGTGVAGTLGARRRGWFSRARLKLGIGCGGGHHYQEQAQLDREMHPRSRDAMPTGRPEQHLLGDMEGHV